MIGRLEWYDRADALQSLVPDPCAPLTMEPVAAKPQRRLAKQRQSRSIILSSTRQLVAEQGLDNVHMQAVADRSGVSLQTVYNLVGTRQEMLSSAATEWVVSMAQRAAVAAREKDLNVCFTTMELFWAGSIGQKLYASNLVHSRAHRGFLERPFLHTATMVIAAQLRDLRAADAIVRWVDVPLLASALARSAHRCISDWLDAPYDEGSFHNALINSCGLVLRGAIIGDEVARLERGFDAAWAHGSN